MTLWEGGEREMGLGVEVCCRNGLGRGIRDGLGVCFLIGRLGCHGPAYLLFVAKWVLVELS